MIRKGTIILCLTCGAKKYYPASRIKIGRKFCSRKCVYTKEWKRLISEKRKLNNPGGFKKREQTSLSKIDQKTYNTLHRNWVMTHLKKTGICKHCHKEKLISHQIHWANISSEYKKEKNDWIELCAKCHFAYDKSKYETNLLQKLRL